MFHPNIAVTRDGKIKYDLSDEEKAALAKNNADKYIMLGIPVARNLREEAYSRANERGCNRQILHRGKNFRCILNKGNAARQKNLQPGQTACRN